MVLASWSMISHVEAMGTEGPQDFGELLTGTRKPAGEVALELALRGDIPSKNSE